MLYAWVKKGAPRPDDGGDAVEKPATGGTYTVKPGDTLSKIGERLGVPWPDIAKANNIKTPYRIHPGDKLTIPKAAATAPAKPARPTVDLSRLQAAARTDPPSSGQRVTYSGVRIVEDALVKEGLLARSLADGHFGTATLTAYSRWQQRLGYRGADADGIPGRTSLERLGDKHGFTVVP
ncbi:LysM peptidoglycan-binding domain-containing protein [Streptomyces radiopugnans]|nr:LysM peptidoglycan-binding domain-containing protein [Streptomyces radiopugnans]